MRKTLLAIAAAVLASSSAWTKDARSLSPTMREGVIQVFTLGKWVAGTAARNCDNMALDWGTLFAANRAVNMTEAERLRGERYLGGVIDNMVRAEYAAGHAEWCASAYRMYGPNGSGIPGLIKDKE